MFGTIHDVAVDHGDIVAVEDIVVSKAAEREVIVRPIDKPKQRIGIHTGIENIDREQRIDSGSTPSPNRLLQRIEFLLQYRYMVP